MTNEQINEMKKAMQTIGKICNSLTEWSECDDCPFDDYCTAINDAYWNHKWHDMYNTFCEGEAENEE